MVTSMTYMKPILLHFLLFVSDSFADSGSYVWYLLPKAGNRLHGYQEIKQQSFESEILPNNSFVSREDGINGLWIPANQKIVLGDFAAGCFSNVSICTSFTLSFLFKINESLSQNETIHFLHEMPSDGGDYQVQFSVFYNGSSLSGHATVSRGDNKTETYSALAALLNTWNHAAMVYEEPGLLHLYINGTNVTDRITATNYVGSLSPVDMTLSSLNSSRGFFMSYMKVVPNALNETELQDLGTESWTQAMSPTQAEVFFNQSIKSFTESVGKVEIVISRAGNLGVASVLKLTLTNDTAVPSDVDLIVSQSDGLFFKPGETVKRLNFTVSMDTIPEVDVKFNLTLSSDDRVTDVTGNILQVIIEDDDVDECAERPCQNGGVCMDLVADYNCTCQAGFAGKNCGIRTSSYLWYLFPVGARRVYGYDPETNRSFASEQVSDGTAVELKDGIRSLHIRPGDDVTLGDFATSCLQDIALCDSFTVSFLVYIKGAITVAGSDVKVLLSKSIDRGPYQIEFIVKRVTPASAEGHVFVVGLNATILLERKGEFPGTNQWVHVAIVYSTEAVDLYMNSVVVTNPTTSHVWASSGSQVQLALGSASNTNDIFLSYFQIIRGNLSEQEIQQLDMESRTQAANAERANVQLLQDNLVENEGVGKFVIPVHRTGNLFIASVLSYFSKNGSASSGVDFAGLTDQESVIRPGEKYGSVEVSVTDDMLPEMNETFTVTIFSSDNVTTFTRTDVNITILNDDVDDCDPSPCENNATCTDLHLDYRCDCAPGYEGRNCSEDIDDCADNSCENGGTCNDRLNSFTCSCPPGFAGRNCSHDAFLWYLFPAGAARIYGYDSETGVSSDSNPLPANVSVEVKDNTFGLCIPTGGEVILGDFASQCLGDPSICETFTISFLTIVNGPVGSGEYVHVLYSTPVSQGRFLVQFTVTRTAAGLEGQAYVVGGTSAKLLERKGPFPGLNQWVYVAIVYSRSPEVIELYMNGLKTSNPLLERRWNSSGSDVEVSLGSRNNTGQFCVSYLQVTKVALTEDEVQQLERESRAHAMEPFMVEVGFNVTDIITEENAGSVVVPVKRTGNLVIASVLTFAANEVTAKLTSDFEPVPMEEVVIKPGQNYGQVVVDIEEDFFPESNETFLLRVASSDNVTFITAGIATVKILDNDIDECAFGPCQNNATCSDLHLDYVCTCSPGAGYEGKNCSENVNDCAEGPCQHNGTCIDLLNDYNCTCAPGYKGKNCSEDIDECEPAPCQNNGTCENLLADYNCTCIPGFTGLNCETNIDDCKPAPCLNNGICMDLLNDYNCTCAPGYKGKNCSEDIDDCEPAPCQNNGICMDFLNDYNCTCAPGYKGKNCSEDIDECEPAPCQNNGTCENLLADYNCTCIPGFTGLNCETNIDECEPAPCQNNGTCENLLADYNCTCIPGFTGRRCDTNINDCAVSPCQHNGSCVDLLNDYRCFCAVGYKGKNCSEDIDECSENGNPCKNEGKCTDEVNGYRCLCANGFEGKNCATASASKAAVEDDNEVLLILIWAAVAILIVTLLATILGICLLCKLFRRSGWSNP